MKKIMIFAAIAAMFSLASCQKEIVDNSSVESPVFTATIDGGDTKTTIDLSDGKNGKIAWEDSDEITVKDASSKSAKYVIESIDPETRKATFVIKAGQTALGAGPYSATYGDEPSTTQTYSATAGKLHMTAPETGTNSFTFTVACGLMKLNLTKAGESVKSVAVTGTTGGSETTYTLNCESAESIATAKDFFIALPEGSYTKIVITNSSDEVCTLDANSPVVVTNNHIKPVTIVESKITFQANIPEGAMSGIFSVSPTKKVRFSKGNLYYDGTDFKFEENQYTFSNEWNESHVGIFQWSKNASNAYAENYDPYFNPSESDVFFTNSEEEKANPDFTVNGISGKYRCLSVAELKYLFNIEQKKNEYDEYEDSIIEDGIRKDKYYLGIKITNLSDNCIILLPDDWDNTVLSSTELQYITRFKMVSAGIWQKMENAGAVCLSCGSNSLGFWSSSVRWVAYYYPEGCDMIEAYYLSLYGQFGFDWANGKNCVRLVTDVN